MPPSTDWKEKVDPDEPARFERYAQFLTTLQRRVARGGRAKRAVHNKGQLGLQAQFEVLPDLPPHARVALFSRPAIYRAYVRFSNGSPRHQPDRKPDVRGVAIKVVGVDGKKVIPGLQNARTQDFLMIRTSATAFRSADEFVSVIAGAASLPLGLLKAGREVGFGRLLQILRRTLPGLKAQTVSVATTRYFSALPIRYGAYAVRYALKPHATASAEVRRGTSPNYLAEEMAERLKGGPVSYDFQVQFFIDETRTPIEDASVDWNEVDAPYVTVARLTIPQQDTASDHGRKLAAQVEEFSFDPWHAVEDLRPLGNMMRARNVAYRVSTGERKAAGEPDGSEWSPPRDVGSASGPAPGLVEEHVVG